MSRLRPHAAASTRARAPALAWLLALLAGMAACSEGETPGDDQDGSFGRGVTDYPRDAGMDAALVADEAAEGGGGIRVRFLHTMVNLGTLLVCHDPDHTGPLPGRPLWSGASMLRASFGERSAPVDLPAPLMEGALTLQRSPVAPVPTGDGGIADAGTGDPCSEPLREATIPLPYSGHWLDPRMPVDALDMDALGVARALTGSPALTLFGSGLALDSAALAARAALARTAALAERPDDAAYAEAAYEAERRTIEARFGARGLLQHDPTAPAEPRFALGVLHAVPDVPASTPAEEGSAVGAIRLCVTAGSRESRAVPEAPLPGIPYRYRVMIGSNFDAGLSYHFRAFSQRAFDDTESTCAEAVPPPIAELLTSPGELRGGHTYTLALIGAREPVSLCSPPSGALPRPGCGQPASELGARILLLED